MLKITLSRGLVAKTEKQIKVVKALGLGKFGSSVVQADSPTIRGMITKISHLLTVETIDSKEGKATTKSGEKKAALKAKKAQTTAV